MSIIQPSLPSTSLIIGTHGLYQFNIFDKMGVCRNFRPKALNVSMATFEYKWGVCRKFKTLSTNEETEFPGHWNMHEAEVVNLN